jgi:hypothetical protein
MVATLAILMLAAVVAVANFRAASRSRRCHHRDGRAAPDVEVAVYVCTGVVVALAGALMAAALLH